MAEKMNAALQAKTGLAFRAVGEADRSDLRFSLFVHGK